MVDRSKSQPTNDKQPLEGTSTQLVNTASMYTEPNGVPRVNEVPG